MVALGVATFDIDIENLFPVRLSIDSVQTIVSLLLLAVLAKEVNWRTALDEVGATKRYALVAAFLLVAGVATGLTLPEDGIGYVEDSLDSLDDLAESSEGYPDWQMGIVLFGNNTRMAIGVGMLLAAIPLLGSLYAMFSMLLNGALIGVVAVLIDKPPAYLLAGLAPHGIFELPAIVLAAGLGLRTNIILVKGVVAAARDKESRTVDMLYSSIRDIKRAWAVMYLILVLLVIAAIIEAYITPELLSLAI
jgi:stage II sporulation protein M